MMTEDEMVGWHHRLGGHGCGQVPGDVKDKEAWCSQSPWVHKELDI